MGIKAARLLAISALSLVPALIAAPAALAAPAFNGTFPVPGIETNNKIVAGPDGNMWVTLAGEANNVARITPAGDVKEFDLNLKDASGIAVGPDGNLWVTETEGVASFKATDPVGTVKATAIPAIKTFHSIVAGPDGKMWVATFEDVLRFSTLTPALPEEKKVVGLSPRDIDVAGGLVVISDGGNPRIVTFTIGFVEKDFSIAAAGASQGVAGSPGGQIAFTDPGAVPEQVGLITPPNPAQSSELLNDPFGVALGSDGAFWIAQFSGEVTRMTSAGVKTSMGGLTKESPRQIAAGPGNTMWVTLVKAGSEGVVRISGLEPSVATTPPPPPPIAAPDTKIDKGPEKNVKTFAKRAKVSFRFSSTTPGTTFECALTKVKKGKKAPAPKFTACKSPSSYNLAPGKYRFAVQAVNAGVVDPSAATVGFRVIRVHRRAHRH